MKYLYYLTLLMSHGLAFSAPLYTESNKQLYVDKIYEGCMLKQSQSSSNSALKPAAISSVCRCYGQKVTDELFGNIEFQTAFSKKNDRIMKQQIDYVLRNDNAMANFNACTQDARKKFGSLYADEPKNKSTPKVGLSGDIRYNFVNAGVNKCISKFKAETVNVPPDATYNYCSCFYNYFADNVSERDIIDQKDLNGPDFKKISSLASNKCINRLPK